MIRRVLSIGNFRVFQRWEPGGSSVDFQRINLIYGVNGSGKSTLASLVSGAAADAEWKSGLQLSVVEGADVRTVRSAEDELWGVVNVFNKDYIERNLRFNNSGASTGQPLLTLGEQRIDRDEQIDAANLRLLEIAEALPIEEAKASKASRDAAQIATSSATQISQELSKAGQRYAPRSYDARKVKDLLATTTPGYPDDEVKRCLAVVNSDEQKVLSELDRLEFRTEELEAKVAEVLGRTAQAKIIDRLRTDHEASVWVQSGLELHHPGDECLFCGGPVTADQIEHLARHFDDSLRQLQTDLGAVSSQLSAAGSHLLNVVTGLPRAAEFDPSLRTAVEAAHAAIETEHRSFSERLASLQAALDDKRENMFDAQKLTAAGAPTLVDLKPLGDAIAKHNALVASLTERKVEAASKVESSRVEAIRKTYISLVDTAEQATGTAGGLKEEQRQLRQQIRDLSQEDLDATPLADELNADLSRLLGRDELRFMLADDGYTIERGGKPATYVSEGERTAISLLYFLKSLRAHGKDIKKAIVVIDDPVSSLDANVVSGVSAHLWRNLVGVSKCHQVFLLTHSFELFRSWSNSLDRLPTATKNAEDIQYSVQELRVRNIVGRDGKAERQPFLLSWPTSGPMRRRLRSEYHYLFWRAASTLQECNDDPSPEKELDAAAIMPNVCRKLLEGFLGFKYPGKIGDFRALMEAGIGTMDESVTRTRLVTYLHQHSHNEEGDMFRGPAQPESVSILNSVFEMINYVDPDHYQKMCAALDVEPLRETEL